MKLEEFEIGEQPVQCGCCDYYSLAERGKCLICPVCFWEDDFDCVSHERVNVDIKSDLNRDLTLREARVNFKIYGAWDSEYLELVISKEERDTLWYEPRNI
ncbi:CPCC family cysteine-rich protein [uncultured Pseudoteredinibacter sp.]|uniref:CPCC family cysteine-rich protein n=1 Tax=uncultured Pseudoteredinibacter sp. TaxID=1641701 RepID=UPI0034499480